MARYDGHSRGGVGRRASLLVAALVLAIPGAVRAGGTLDQQSTAFGSARALIGTHENGQDVRQAQVFAAGASGLLDQVDVMVRAVGNPGVPLTVEVTAVDLAGNPGAVLGSATVAQAAVAACNTSACIEKSALGDYTTFAFLPIALSTPAPVSAGTTYAIVLSATGAALDIYGDMTDRTANRYEWAATTDVSAYGGGDGLSYVGGLGWIQSNADKAFRTYVSPPYAATIRQPINADGSSTFRAGRGVVPVKFGLSAGGVATCDLPPATIALSRMTGTDADPVNESTYLLAADSGSSFRVTDCQYIYNLNAKSLAPGTYRVEIRIGGQTVGTATFDLR